MTTSLHKYRQCLFLLLPLVCPSLLDLLVLCEIFHEYFSTNPSKEWSNINMKCNLYDCWTLDLNLIFSKL